MHLVILFPTFVVTHLGILQPIIDPKFQRSKIARHRMLKDSNPNTDSDL